MIKVNLLPTFQGDRSTTVYLNPAHIVKMQRVGDRTVIVLSVGDGIHVSQEPDEIMTLMAKAKMG